jgi:hypothetical protein
MGKGISMKNSGYSACGCGGYTVFNENGIV